MDWNLARREMLYIGSVGLLSSLAGCPDSFSGSSTSEEQTFDRLDTTSIYIADSVELSLPQVIQTTPEPSNADLLILPAETAVDAQQAVEWLLDDRIIAILGYDSQPKWLSWVRSNAFNDAFENRGYSKSEPTPYLVTGARIGAYYKPYKSSFGGDSNDRTVLRAMDNHLVDIHKERSDS